MCITRSINRIAWALLRSWRIEARGDIRRVVICASSHICTSSFLQHTHISTAAMARTKKTETATATEKAAKRVRNHAIVKRREELLKAFSFAHRVQFPIVPKAEYLRVPYGVSGGNRPHDAEFLDVGFALLNDRSIEAKDIPPNCALSDWHVGRIIDAGLIANKGKTHPADFDISGNVRAERPPRGDSYKEKAPRGSVYYYSRRGGRLLLGDNDAHLRGIAGFELVQKDTRPNQPQPRCPDDEQHDIPMTAERFRVDYSSLSHQLSSASSRR